MSTPTVPDSEAIGIKLKGVILNDRMGLQTMYGGTEAVLNESLTVPIKRGEEMARKLIRDMGCGYEIARDLTVLTLYDAAVLIDDSDSMVHEENGARKEALIQYVDSITEIYSMANPSGILAMRFMNGTGGKRNWAGSSSRAYLDSYTYGGLTRIGTELKKKILDIYAIGKSNQGKPLLVLIVTDGAVEGERRGYLNEVIRDCVNERARAGRGFEAVTFQFTRIGNDPGAARLLLELDQARDLREYIDVLPIAYDFRKHLEGDKWFVLPKILLGAILPDWCWEDRHDIPAHKVYLAETGKDGGEGDSGDDWGHG